MDMTRYCRMFYSATGVHISLLHGDEPVYSSMAEALSLPLGASHWSLYRFKHNPYFCNIPPNILYGGVHVEGTEDDVLLGPIFNIPASDELLVQLSQFLMIPQALMETFRDVIRCAPVMNGMQLNKHLALLHMTFNGKDVDYDAIYNVAEASAPEATEAKTQAERLESGEMHNSYYYEVAMYQKVREGSREQLTHFFQENAHLNLREGCMAQDPLRHAKNVFITSVARTGFIGAIPGGLDIGKAYQLMDYYIRECEQLQTVEAVNNLQYAMVQDLCGRTGDAKRPEGISTDAWHCMNFIRSHVYETIRLADVADSVHRSISYVSKLFKRDLDVHVSAYITRSKLEEAQTLLIYTEKSLSQISSDLCFSSQSYFQNLFKKEFGVTPAQFRRRARKI